MLGRCLHFRFITRLAFNQNSQENPKLPCSSIQSPYFKVEVAPKSEVDDEPEEDYFQYFGVPSLKPSSRE